MTKPVICHLGAWGRNWGDRAIQYALQNAVGREDYEWWNWNIQEHQWHGGSLTHDLLIIGGGGLLWDKPELGSPSGWQWQIEPSTIEDIDIPIIVHAIGDTRFPYGDDQTGKRPEFKESLTILAEKAISFSVRDELTRCILADMDIGTTLCPDPALFIGEPRTEVPDGPPILGVCLAWDKAPWRWPGRLQGAATFVEYMDVLERALGILAAQGWRLRPFCHIEADEPTVALCQDAEGIPAKLRRLDLRVKQPWEDVCQMSSVLSWYSQCTAVVSMRKHGIIIPAGLGVPVVGLGDLAEVGSICEQLGVECVTSANASPEVLTRKINMAVRLQELISVSGTDPYGDLRAAHDQHIAKIRGALV